jgi:hypothetical protein
MRPQSKVRLKTPNALREVWGQFSLLTVICVTFQRRANVYLRKGEGKVRRTITLTKECIWLYETGHCNALDTIIVFYNLSVKHETQIDSCASTTTSIIASNFYWRYIMLLNISKTQGKIQETKNKTKKACF